MFFIPVKKQKSQKMFSLIYSICTHAQLFEVSYTRTVSNRAHNPLDNLHQRLDCYLLFSRVRWLRQCCWKDKEICLRENLRMFLL